MKGQMLAVHSDGRRRGRAWILHGALLPAPAGEDGARARHLRQQGQGRKYIKIIDYYSGDNDILSHLLRGL